jgi:SOS-response transcriptional repressor LexA
MMKDQGELLTGQLARSAVAATEQIHETMRQLAESVDLTGTIGEMTRKLAEPSAAAMQIHEAMRQLAESVDLTGTMGEMMRQLAEPTAAAVQMQELMQDLRRLVGGAVGSHGYEEQLAAWSPLGVSPIAEQSPAKTQHWSIPNLRVVAAVVICLAIIWLTSKSNTPYEVKQRFCQTLAFAVLASLIADNIRAKLE